MTLSPSPIDPAPPAAEAIRGRDVAIVFGGLIGWFVVSALAGGIYLAMTIETGQSVSLDGPLSSVAVNATIFLLQSLMMIGLTYFVVLRRRGLSISAIGLRPFKRRWFAVVPVLALLVVIVSDWAESSFGRPLDQLMVDTLAPEGFTWTSLIVMLAIAGILAPIGEEIFFRGVLYTWLRQRWGPVVGAIFSSLAFGVIHIYPFWIAFAFILGLVLALLYEFSDSLWPAIGLHVINNAISVIWLYAFLV